MLDLKAGEHRTQDTPPQLIAPERERLKKRGKSCRGMRKKMG